MSAPTDYVPVTCWQCKIVTYHSAAVDAVFRQSSQTFYCPYGHPGHYRPKEVIDRDQREKDLLRQERDRLAQKIAEKDDQLAAQRRLSAAEIEARDKRIASEREKRKHEERRVAAAKGQVTKLKNRAAAGVCPCCSRSFQNLKAHMATKHPAFAGEVQAADNVIPLKTA